jgi:hypothetical protein
VLEGLGYVLGKDNYVKIDDSLELARGVERRLFEREAELRKASCPPCRTRACASIQAIDRTEALMPAQPGEHRLTSGISAGSEYYRRAYAHFGHQSQTSARSQKMLFCGDY